MSRSFRVTLWARQSQGKCLSDVALDPSLAPGCAKFWKDCVASATVFARVSPLDKQAREAQGPEMASARPSSRPTNTSRGTS